MLSIDGSPSAPIRPFQLWFEVGLLKGGVGPNLPPFELVANE